MLLPGWCVSTAYPRFQLARAHRYGQRTAGDLSLANTASVLLESSTLLRLTLEAQVNDVIEYGLAGFFTPGAAAECGFSAAAVNPSTNVITNHAGPGTRDGLLGYGATSMGRSFGGPARLTVQTADIMSDGKTTMTLTHFSSNTSVLIYADSLYSLQWWMKNLGPSDPE